MDSERQEGAGPLDSLNLPDLFNYFYRHGSCQQAVIAWKELVYLSKSPYKLKAKALGMDMQAPYLTFLV